MNARKTLLWGAGAFVLLIAGSYMASGGLHLEPRPFTVTVVDLERGEPVEGAVVCARWVAMQSLYSRKLFWP